MRKLYKIILPLHLALLLAIFTGLTYGGGTALATPAEDACAGIQAAGGSCDTGAGDGGFGNIVRTVIDVLSIIVGAVSVIMVIIGGFRYVVSAGESNAVSGAKNTILYAIVGLVIVLFAQIIVRFVMKNVDAT